MTQSDEIGTLGAEFAALIPAWTQGPARHPIQRTRRTEERKPIDPYLRKVVYTRDHFRCVWCGKGGAGIQLVLDHHPIPWSAGGSDEPDNLRTLCWECNEKKSNFKTPDESFRPLPITYYCVICYGESGETIPNEPDVGPAFCYWHRRATVGHRTAKFMEQQQLKENA